MCIHTYSHKDIYTYIFAHICIHTSPPLTETPRSLDFQRSPDGEKIHPLNLTWKLKNMVWNLEGLLFWTWIWPKLLGPCENGWIHMTHSIPWEYWHGYIAVESISSWQCWSWHGSWKDVVLFKWFGAISLSVVECFGRCGWALDLGDHSPLVTLFNYKMMKIPSGWKKAAQFTKNSFWSLWFWGFHMLKYMVRSHKQHGESKHQKLNSSTP
jgi:hypothetical protein